jgi:hypothetical protein
MFPLYQLIVKEAETRVDLLVSSVFSFCNSELSNPFMPDTDNICGQASTIIAS